MLCSGLRVEEETRTSVSLLEEIASKGRNPAEDGETSAGLEDKECDDLLEKQTDDDGGPDVSPTL